jgi:hypothetical protein
MRFACLVFLAALGCNKPAQVVSVVGVTCTSDNACSGGTVCKDGVCQVPGAGAATGAAGGACGPAGTCNDGLECVSGLCQPTVHEKSRVTLGGGSQKNGSYELRLSIQPVGTPTSTQNPQLSR